MVDSYRPGDMVIKLDNFYNGYLLMMITCQSKLIRSYMSTHMQDFKCHPHKVALRETKHMNFYVLTAA